MNETAMETSENPFGLDVQVVTDVRSGDAVGACSTNDGCSSTCASACASRG